MIENNILADLVPDSKKSQVKIETPFHCSSLQADISVGTCVDRYVEANAFGFKDSACFKCPEGLRIRQLLASD